MNSVQTFLGLAMIAVVWGVIFLENRHPSGAKGAQQQPAKKRQPRSVVEAGLAAAEAKITALDGLRQTSEKHISDLEKTAAHLRERGRVAVAQRDEWEKRALSAEQKLASNGASMRGSNGKYEELKRLLAKELHPDSGATPFEKGMKSEMFKLLWPKVEDIDRK